MDVLVLRQGVVLSCRLICRLVGSAGRSVLVQVQAWLVQGARCEVQGGKRCRVQGTRCEVQVASLVAESIPYATHGAFMDTVESIVDSRSEQRQAGTLALGSVQCSVV